MADALSAARLELAKRELALRSQSLLVVVVFWGQQARVSRLGRGRQAQHAPKDLARQ